jgi:hypothetical protein
MPQAQHPLRPEQLGRESEAIDAIAINMIPETMPGALGLRALITEGIRQYIGGMNFGSWEPVFKPDERVELVEGGYGGNPTTLHPGTVVEIDAQPRIHLSLRVRFDDGEERHINPDVMRRIRDEK